MKKAVLIAGGARSGSIGFVTVQKFLDEGWQVYLLDIVEPTQISHDSLRFVPCNLVWEPSVTASVLSAMQMIRMNDERLYGVVYAAGYNRMGAVIDYDVEDWHRTVALNAMAPWLITQTLLQEKERNPLEFADEVRTVIFGSNTGYVAKTKTFAYAFSKAGVQHMARCMHRELAPQGFTFSTLDFGIVFDSDMTDITRRQLKEQRGWDREEADEMLLRNVPTKKPVTREEIATMSHYLINELNSFGGCSLRMDSGQQQG